MSKKPYKVGSAFVLALLFLFANTLSAQEQGPETGTTTVPAKLPLPASNSLAGKTVWIVDVNTTESYKSTLQTALVDQLPRYAPGVIVRHVTTNEKGNPFFMLRREDYPDAVIISLGVCDGTTNKVANYASEAKKKGIPSVMCYLGDLRDDQVKWNKAYRNPDAEAIEIETMPETHQEAMPMAERLVPIFIEKLKY